VGETSRHGLVSEIKCCSELIVVHGTYEYIINGEERPRHEGYAFWCPSIFLERDSL
jgi:hypothetical protein